MSKLSLTLADGRKLELERLSLRDRMRLIRATGPAADIDRYMGPVMLAACVRSIDGVPVMLPTSVDQCDALMERLGDVALAEVARSFIDEPAPAPLNTERVKN